jgi:long-subunit fatty acid transport protein
LFRKRVSRGVTWQAGVALAPDKKFVNNVGKVRDAFVYGSEDVVVYERKYRLDLLFDVRDGACGIGGEGVSVQVREESSVVGDNHAVRGGAVVRVYVLQAQGNGGQFAPACCL